LDMTLSENIDSILEKDLDIIETIRECKELNYPKEDIIKYLCEALYSKFPLESIWDSEGKYFKTDKLYLRRK